MDLQKNKETTQRAEADRSKWTVHSNHNLKCFTESEIEQITNNYKTIIGRGAFGEVYKGIIEDNSIVAVKRFIHDVEENFDQELTIHREINHRNVVRLIGYCVEENALMMVTEFIPNGNLTRILHHDNTPIPLDIRLRIATQCAEALTYMHSYMYTQVIHGDIKPDNILLDGNMNAKVSDFGISRLVTTEKTLYTGNVVGSIGYMDPLFAQDGRLTAKSDVYSFGVVLLELLTRKKATTKDGEASIVTAYTEAHATGRMRRVRNFFDSELDPLKNKNILDEVGKLAAECLAMKRDKRPEMKQVAERLGTSMKASLERKQRVDLFHWPRKTKPALVNIPATARNSTLCRRFSAAEMVAATRNFDKSLRLGEGDRFYHGLIDGGATTVAIEVWWHMTEDDYGGRSLHSLVESRSKICHDNIVPLIGYCDESEPVRILVYNYMARGSLHEYLSKMTPLSWNWKQLLRICIGAARGLHYLYTGGANAIIHPNLRPENILLDEEWVAKISGFEATDCHPISRATMPRRSAAAWEYPQYITPCPINEESDVFSFGAVLLTVLTNLQEFEQTCPDLVGKTDARCLNKFVETSQKCLALKASERPQMTDVIRDLEYALKLQEIADAKRRTSR